jgi:capsule biosynthesis phosphatase
MSKKKIFIFDIDNTICVTKNSDYNKSVPKNKIIKFMNQLKDNGHIIKIFTSRYMGRNNENSKLVKKKYTTVIKKQLKNWGVKYNELILGKPSFDFFIDDKTLNPKKVNITAELKKFIK